MERERREGQFRDSDYLELHHEHMVLQHELRKSEAKRHHAEVRLGRAREHIEALRALIRESESEF